MAAAQATGWHAMSDSAADAFRKENYIIADIIVYLENLIFRNFQDEDLPPAVLRAIGSRQMLDAKTVQGQERYFDNKSSQPAAVADKKQQEVKVGSKSYIRGSGEKVRHQGAGRHAIPGRAQGVRVESADGRDVWGDIEGRGVDPRNRGVEAR